MHNRRQTAK